MAAGPEADDLLPFHLCEDLVCCVVCYEQFSEERTPKALPCLHSFCKSCLTACIMAHKKRSKLRNGDKKAAKGEFPCPVCKDVTKIPSNGLDGFRDDFRIRRISDILSKSMDIVRNSSTDDLEQAAEPEPDQDNYKCDVCMISKTESLAEQYCLDCFKSVCVSCVEAHRVMALTSDHKLIAIPQGCEEPKLPGSTSCPQHVSEPLRYYCKDCSDVLCMTCSMDTEHQSHDMVRLSEHVPTIRHKVTTTLSDTWREVIDTERKLDEIDSLERELKTKEVSVKRAILSKTLEEIFRARQRQHKMEQDLESVCARKIQTLQNQRQVCKDFVDAARSRCSLVESLVEHGHDLHVVHSAREYVPNMKELSEAGKMSMSVLDNITDLGKYDTFLTELYAAKDQEGENTQESILAEIRSVVSEIRQLSTSPSNQPEAIPAADRKVQLIKKIGRKGSAEGEFSFPSGITFITSGELVVADMHNHRVQIFGMDGEFRRSFGSPSFKPCGIVAKSDGNLAVTDCCTGKSGIKVFTPFGELKQSLGEGQFEYPFSIAIDTKDRYVVCDSATNRIIILKENGEFYRRFATKTKFAFYLALTSRNEILLSDWFNHCVKVFDTSGTLLRKIGSKGIQDGQLMIPLGLCPDKSSNIYILDCKCGRVSMFTVDGRFVKHLIGQDEGIEYSRAIAVSSLGQLAVSSGDNRGNIPNEVRLYKIT